ncbi:MAG: hypothetical protein QOE23_3476 [Pseudonocardiales bacterium]|jgi:hypothetical protein|nr:hypothetical protein [Pseudonocardiales bacterium]
MTRTAGWLAPMLALGLTLAGCGSSSSPSAEPAGSSSSSSPSASASSSVVGPSAPAFASTSAGTPRGVLSKPDFLVDTNAMCSAVDAQLQALPTPSGATDYAGIITNLTGTLRIMPVYIAHAEALVARTAERADLEKNWLDVERADYAAFKPAAQRLLRAADTRDPAKVAAAANDLSAVPDHSSDVQAYLEDFGLASCAHIEAD